MKLVYYESCFVNGVMLVSVIFRNQWWFCKQQWIICVSLSRRQKMTEHYQYFLNRQMQITLYALKRQFGGPIVIYRLLTSVVDPKTGEALVNTLAIRIKRAIILPVTMTREVVRNISLISADKQMVQGGGYETGKRVFIIDKRDARTLVLSQDDWIVWNGRKYQFEKIEEMEFDSGWIITGKVLLGETDLEVGCQQIVDVTDDIELASEAIGEV
jgi:hypothetical protein